VEVKQFYRQVSSLPTVLQVAFCLRYVAGRALSDIARLLNCSVAELRSKLQRAEARLGALPDLLPDDELVEVGG
jgi:DNA-directed RNA polymerase specialized sigma24 family protein